VLIGGGAWWVEAWAEEGEAPDMASILGFFKAGNDSGDVGSERGVDKERGADRPAANTWSQGLGDLGSGGWLLRRL
jgi:hypothetical protein